MYFVFEPALRPQFQISCGFLFCCFHGIALSDPPPCLVFSRFSSSCVILDNAKMHCFGRNFDGQLGLGDTADRGYQVGRS